MWEYPTSSGARGHAHQLWDEGRKLFAIGSKGHPELAAIAKDLTLADIFLELFLTSKHCLWLDLHTTEDDQLHGSDRRVDNASEGVMIQITKNPWTPALNFYLYVLMDAQLNIEWSFGL